VSDDHRPLRVVAVLTTHAAGGAEYATVDLLEALARRGHDVALLTNRPARVAGTTVPAVPIDLGPKLRRRTALRTALTAPMMLRRLTRALRREAERAPIDVLLLGYKKEQLLGTLLPRRVAGAVAWAEWGPLPAPLRGGVAARVYALAARSARVILAESDRTAASLRAVGVEPDRIVVVPNVLDDHGTGFDPEARAALRREWGLADDAFVLGCVSRLDAQKRIDVLIAALARLDERVVLVIAGEGEDEARLRSLAAPLGGRVRFVGSARGRFAALMSACDLQAYAPGPSEGAARVVTLGQLAGRAVIATAPEGTAGIVAPGPARSSTRRTTLRRRRRSSPPTPRTNPAAPMRALPRGRSRASGSSGPTASPR
jgi:glycosyltransferase involved in cell wall biosynthesis